MFGKAGTSVNTLHRIILLSALLLAAGTITFASNPSIDSREYDHKLYVQFIQGDISMWDDIIEKMEKTYHEVQEPWLRKQIVLSIYGYIGYNLGIDDEETAERYLEKLEGYLSTIMDESDSIPAWAYAMHGASVGFRISLNNLSAPFLGREAIESTLKAIATDSTEVMGWTEMGNSFMYRPAIFGGSSQKALDYYQQALSLIGRDEKMKEYNWIFLNLHVLIAQCYIDMEDYDLALNIYQDALRIEPSFTWVRDELMPELKLMISEQHAGN